MSQKTFLQHLETLGYYPLPQTHANSPGFSGLLIVLRENANGHEPEIAQIRLREWDGKSPMKQLHANGTEPLRGIVCPGRVVIRSRQEREATFYTFGGTLDSEQLSGETVFSLRSTAPILELQSDHETLADLLADETEALFARAEAQHQLSSQQLLDLLTSVGAEAVYLAVLHSLLPQSEEMTGSNPYPAGFINLLQQECNWYKDMGRWPLFPIGLYELLQKAKHP